MTPIVKQRLLDEVFLLRCAVVADDPKKEILHLIDSLLRHVATIEAEATQPHDR